MTAKFECENRDAITMLECFKRASRLEQYAVIHGEKKVQYIHGHKCFLFRCPSNCEHPNMKKVYDTVKGQWLD